jgi:GTP-binding protein
MSQFVDQVAIKIRSGDGGNGLVAWRQDKYEPMGGPAGGDGGRGGHVFIKASNNMNTLLDFNYNKEFIAQNGGKGGSKNKSGKSGIDLIIYVPVGTIVKDTETNDVIADLTNNNDQVLVAEGGRGGRGNSRLASPTHRSPYHCEPGQPGIARQLELTLKLIAEVGIIGLPNAGKSTLLSILTNARPKIADYPFSTLSPNLGVLKRPEGDAQGKDAYVLCDIPGLIEGASAGIGLGQTFLRHIERTRILIHMVDISSSNVMDEITTINKELYLYNKELADRPQILALNKADLLPADEIASTIDSIKKQWQKRLPEFEAPLAIETISCATTFGINGLKNLIFEALSKLPKLEAITNIYEDSKAYDHGGSSFDIERKKNTFTVIGDRVERLVSVTNLRSPESLHHLFSALRAIGVIDALVAKGAQEGSEIIIGKTTFEFGKGLSG